MKVSNVVHKDSGVKGNKWWWPATQIRYENRFSSDTGTHLTCEWQKLKDPRKVANAINNSFITSIEKLNIQQIDKKILPLF